MDKEVKLTREQFRNIVINALDNSNCLKDNELGSGYVDWHTENNECGVTFTLINGEKFSVAITKEIE